MSTTTVVKKEHKSIPGIMTCQLDLHIEKATADYRWTGPKITPELWHKILAFFEWTNTTAKSEAQVRLFVNSETKEWAAWAFPQKAGTGMTTKELGDHPNWAENSARFPAPDWYYYGTVHHHCGCGAFQSGTDEANEVEIDGLHITVGKIGSAHYDLDHRVYQSRWRLKSPELSEFWDIGEAAKALVPVELYGTVARHQMCRPAAADTGFPQEWKDNYITPPPIIIHTPPVGMGVHTPHWSGSDFTTGSTDRRLFINDRQRLPSDIVYDCKQAAKQVIQWCEETENLAWAPDELLLGLEQIIQDRGLTELCRLMWLHDLSPGAFAQELDKQLAEKELKQELDAMNDEQKLAQQELDKLAGEGSGVNGYDQQFMS